jgi:hypothetical protein
MGFQKKGFLIYGACALFLWFASAGMADGTSPVEKAKQDLQRQMDLLDAVRPYVERQDLGRLLLLRNASKAVIDSIDTNGPMHVKTMRAYQDLIVTYRYSKVYFSQITTAETEPEIQEIQAIAEDFAKEYGFDDSPYTQITYNVFSQMYKLVLQLEAMPISTELKAKLEDLKAPLGEIIAIAKGGDDYVTFQQAISRSQQIQQLYPLFYQVASSDAAFYLVLEIQGLNEWYIERSRIPTDGSAPPAAPGPTSAPVKP